MEKIKYGFTPTHPGEVIKDEIQYRKFHKANFPYKWAYLTSLYF
jgi:hypothetical protein